MVDNSKINISRYSKSSSYSTVYPSQIKDVLLHVERVGITFCKNDYSINNRIIDSHLICYVFKGEGTLLYNNKKHKLSKGDLFILDCSTLHSYYTDKNNKMSLLFLHYNGPTARAYTHQILATLGPILSHTVTNKYIVKRIGDLYKEQSLIPNEDYFYCANLIHEILMNLLKFSHNSKLRNIVIPLKILSAIKFIEENHTKDITIPIIAKQIYMSPSNFIRTFKKFVETTPHEYLLICKLNHAKSLLLNTTLTISQISELLRFNTVSHFTYFFKNRETLTPFQFRKRYSTLM